MISVHDNWLYAHVVDYQRCRIVLHTVYPHVEPAEYTDVLFEGVVAYQFEQGAFGTLGTPSNILFGVEEADATFVLGQFSELLDRTKNYCWPVFKYDGLEDLVSQLTADGIKCFEICATCGLLGFVFARSMDFRSSHSRAETTMI